MDVVNEIREYYGAGVQGDNCYEWERLTEHRIEFEITKRYIDRYVKPSDSVLDLGGGPGRYSIYLAEKGCDVTLCDLTPQHIEFAKKKAAESGVSIKAFAADAREIDEHVGGPYDHILLMGPMYHLLEQSDRELVVEKCVKLLKPGGTLFVSFISSYAGIIYYMVEAPEAVVDEDAVSDFELFIENREFSGKAFTQAFFIRKEDVLPLFEGFPLEHLHFLSQEGMLAPVEPGIMAQPEHIIEKWIDLAEKVCEREDLLSYASHFMYIGRKQAVET